MRKIKWTFFVLDFDNTYDNESNDGLGVQPLVYLVPKDRIRDVGYYAEQAHNDFHSDENYDLCIGDYFEEWLGNNDVDYRRVGSLDLTFEERRGSYLDESIPMECV